MEPCKAPTQKTPISFSPKRDMGGMSELEWQDLHTKLVIVIMERVGGLGRFFRAHMSLQVVWLCQDQRMWCATRTVCVWCFRAHLGYSHLGGRVKMNF